MSKIKVTLLKSKSGATSRQVRVLEALGIGRRTSSVEVDENPVFLGMIKKVQHMVSTEKL